MKAALILYFTCKINRLAIGNFWVLKEDCGV